MTLEARESEDIVGELTPLWMLDDILLKTDGHGEIKDNLCPF